MSAAVRTLLLATGLILMVIGFGARVGTQQADLPPPAREWVRTVDGWERRSALIPPRRASRSLHPLVVAGVQLCASLCVLVATTPDR